MLLQRHLDVVFIIARHNGCLVISARWLQSCSAPLLCTFLYAFDARSIERHCGLRRSAIFPVGIHSCTQKCTDGVAVVVLHCVQQGGGERRGSCGSSHDENTHESTGLAQFVSHARDACFQQRRFGTHECKAQRSQRGDHRDSQRQLCAKGSNQASQQSKRLQRNCAQLIQTQPLPHAQITAETQNCDLHVAFSRRCCETLRLPTGSAHCSASSLVLLLLQWQR